jgi:hypothetical protein
MVKRDIMAKRHKRSVQISALDAMAPKATDHSPWWLAFAAVVGAIGGAAITGGFNYVDHQGDLDAKMIELGVGILRAGPTPETVPLREWAIDVIQKRAKFSFNEAQRNALLNKELPFIAESGGAELAAQREVDRLISQNNTLRIIPQK